MLAVGKKHEDWVAPGIARFEKRLRKPFTVEFVFVSHSASDSDVARDDESERMLAKISTHDTVVLLDERGTNFDSPQLAQKLQLGLEQAASRGGQLTVVIGGAYGVNDALRERADVIWSLSNLVLPHQLVRLVLIEQIYRAQEILHNRGYHHA